MKVRQAIAWGVPIVVVVVGIGVFVWSRGRSSVDRAVTKARIALEQNDVNQAAEILRQQYGEHPKQYEVVYWLAEAELRLRRTNESRRLAAEAAALDPTKPDPLLVRARSFLSDASALYDQLRATPSEGGFDEADRLCAQALETIDAAAKLAPAGDARIPANRGFSYRRLWSLQYLHEGTLTRQAEAAPPDEARRLRDRAAAIASEERQTGEKAIESLAAALKADPKDSRVAESLVQLGSLLKRPEVVTTAYDTAAAAGPVPPAVAIPVAEDLLHRAIEPVTADDLKVAPRAVQILETCARTFPRDAEVRVKLAWAYLTTGQPAAADEQIAKALEIDSTLPLARLFKGQRLLMTKEYSQAREVLQPLANVLRDSIPYKLAMAEANANTGYPQMALQLYREVLDANPANPEANLALVRDLLQQQQYEPAENRLARALEAAPHSEPILRFAVDYYLGRGQLDRARAALEQAAGRSPLSDRTRSLLAELFLRVGRADRAEAIMIAGGGDELQQQLVMAQLAIRDGRVTEGRQKLEALTKANPQWPRGWIALAQAYQAERQPEDAARALDKALGLARPDPSIRLACAQVYLGMGMVNEAAALSDSLVEELGRNPAVQRLAARVDLLRGDYQSLESRLSILNEIGGNRIEDWLIQAELAFRQGRYDECIALCSAKPEAAGMMLAAEAMIRKGQSEKAADELMRLIDTFPTYGQAYDRLVQVLLTIDTPDGALERLKRLKDPMPVYLELSRAAIWAQMGRYDDAVAAYKKLLGDENSNQLPGVQVALRQALARCYQLKEDKKEELAQYDALAANEKTRVLGLLLRSDFFRRENEIDKAAESLATLSRATGDKEEDIALRRRIAERYLWMRRTDDAIAELNRALAVRPDIETLVLDKVLVYTGGGRLDDALRVANEAVKRWPTGLNALTTLVNVYTLRLEIDRALEALDRLAQVSETGRLLAAVTRAELFERLGLYERAVRELKDLLSADESKTRPYMLTAARSLIGLGRFDEARAVMTRVPEDSPYYRSAQLLVADSFRREGRPADMAKVLRVYLDRHPDDDPVAYELFDALVQAGRLDEADRLAEAQMAPLPIRARGAIAWRLLRTVAARRVQDWSKAIGEMRTVVEAAPDVAEYRWQLAMLYLIGDQRHAAADLLASEAPESVFGLIVRPLAGSPGAAPTSQPTAWHDAVVAKVRDPRVTQEVRMAGVLAMLCLEPDSAPVLTLLEDDSIRSPMTMMLREHVERSAGADAKVRRSNGLLALAAVATSYGWPEIACAFCEFANTVDPDSPILPFLWVTPLKQLHRQAEAEKVAEAAITRLGDSRIGLELGVWDAIARQDHATALAKIEAARAAGPLSPEMMTAAGATELLQGHAERALSWFENALAARPDDVDAMNNVAYLLAETHPDDPATLERAAKLADEALKKAPNNAGIAETAAWIRVCRGDARGGLEGLLKVLPAVRDDIRVQYHVAACYRKLGRFDLARLHAEAVAESPRTDQPEVEMARTMLKELPAPVSTPPAATQPASGG